MLLQCLPSSFSSIWLTVWVMAFEDFQDGRHGSRLGYRNGTILEILNLYVGPMPPIKFQLNLNCGLGGDVVWRIQRWPPWWPSMAGILYIRTERFYGFGSHLGYPSVTILAILNLYVTVMPSIKFGLNPTYGLEGDVDWKISRWPPWQPSWISERNNFSNSESPCCHKKYLPLKFQLYRTYGSGGDVENVKS